MNPGQDHHASPARPVTEYSIDRMFSPGIYHHPESLSRIHHVSAQEAPMTTAHSSIVPSPQQWQKGHPYRSVGSQYMFGEENINTRVDAIVEMNRARQNRMNEGRCNPGDWRQESSVQERGSSRKRIEYALQRQATNYEELLLIVSAIDEELLHISSYSKTQYLDSAKNFHILFNDNHHAYHSDPCNNENTSSASASVST
jgi:hypothetical protein